MDANEVLGVQDAIFILTGRINDLGRIFLASIANSLAEGVLDSRIVAVNEMSVDELHGKRRFS